MMQADQLAEILKLHRKAAGLSRIQLADLAGVGKTVIFDIEIAGRFRVLHCYRFAQKPCHKNGSEHTDYPKTI